MDTSSIATAAAKTVCIHQICLPYNSLEHCPRFQQGHLAQGAVQLPPPLSLIKIQNSVVSLTNSLEHDLEYLYSTF